MHLKTQNFSILLTLNFVPLCVVQVLSKNVKMNYLGLFDSRSNICMSLILILFMLLLLSFVLLHFFQIFIILTVKFMYFMYYSYRSHYV